MKIPLAIVASIFLVGCSNGPGRAPASAPFFAEPWKASFQLQPDGLLEAKGEDEGRPGRLLARFPPTAAGELYVEASSGQWVKERLAGARTARAEVNAGRLEYPGALRGVDRVYEVTSHRVEEFLRIADAQAAEALSFELETGPGIADLVVDGSGSGLVAVDAEARPVLKAPQPLGLDAQRQQVTGRLVATRISAHHFTIQVRLLSAGPVFPVVLDPGWISTGTMAGTRTNHTATLLQNGKVLVVGGSGVTALASAELYDPATATWSATASMATARFYHTATLLSNGKVLVAAGSNGAYQSSAELLRSGHGDLVGRGNLVERP